MTYNRLPKDLPDRLRKAGLNVVEIPGWETRGRPPETGDFNPVGSLNHHTGDKASGLPYARWLFLTGRPDLPAPLCNISISRDGTVYVGAAGRTNHAGKAKSVGTVAAGDGNALYVGIEWQLTGTEPIPTLMYDAGATVNAVLLEEFDTSEQTVHCHYETSVTGKWDIGDPNGIPFKGHKVLDVAKFQARVKAKRAALHPAPPVKATGTRRAPRRRVAHFDQRVPFAGGILGDSAAGSRKADAEGYTWADNNGHLTKDLHWVNGHGAPYNPGWLKAGDKFEHYSWSTLHKKHPALRDARQTFKQNAKLGLSTEWEVKDLHPLVSDEVLAEAFAHLAESAKAAYGADWQRHVQIKVLTNLAGGLAYARKIGRHARAAGFDVIVLPRGVDRFRKINGPEFTFNRGGRV